MKRIVIILSVLLLTLAGCTEEKNTGKVEYENKVDINAKDVDMSVYPGMGVTDHAFKKVTMEEANRMYEEGGTGVVVYGFPECPFCTKAMPILNETALEMGVTVYYVNSRENPDEAAFAKFTNFAKDFLIQQDNEAVLYVPNVFVIKDGVILGNHLSLVDSYEGGSMTDKQIAELKGIYQGLFNKLNN